MRFFRPFSAIALLMALANCSESKESVPAPLVVDEQPKQSYLVGIRAEEFECESLFPLAEAKSVFGGRVELQESPMTPPAGVPKACNYMSFATERTPLGWSFDLDCREGALKDASQLMVGYADAPGAKPMLIGQSALDHNDSALLFIDDDTPCYGRVLGPGQEIRAKIAVAVTAALNLRTAPTGAHLQAR